MGKRIVLVNDLCSYGTVSLTAMDAVLSRMGYATSLRFPDALAGAALLGKQGSVLLLADQATQGNLSFSTSHTSEMTHGYVFGGSSAFSDECFARLAR